MKKNISTWSAIGICLLSIIITSCNSCTKAEEKAWAKFFERGKECSAQYDAFIANCNSKEAEAWAELQTCNGSCKVDIAGCFIDPNCIQGRLNDYSRCKDACMESYRQKIKAIEECKQNWNVAFWDCMNAKEK
jgi:hypothetical protein